MSDLSQEERDRKATLTTLLEHPGWSQFCQEAALRMASHGRVALSGQGQEDRKRADHALMYDTISRLLGWPAAEISHLIDKEKRDI